MIKENISLSIVIPAFNESACLSELFKRLEKVAIANKYKMQIILVNDGSLDDTKEIALNYSFNNINTFTYIGFRKNFGKSMAISEGVRFAQESLIVTMDADLQDMPEEIPKLINRLNDGYDIVSGWKKNRKDPFFAKKLPSIFFNTLVRKILHSELNDINCGLKVYRKNVWDEIQIYGEFHRFIPALATNLGFKVGEIEVIHQPRFAGRSKYGASRFVKGVFDLLTVYFLNTYKQRPLHFFGLLGGSLLSMGIFGCSYLIILWFSGNSIGTRPLLMFSVLFIIVGIQIILFGLLSQLQIAQFNKITREHPSSEIFTKKIRVKNIENK